jgi:2-polyprenyl-6-methoxyphenol hydroxylase-like FAD-dependent oxidoreductase
MQTVVVGAGPTGLYTAIALARHGHRVRVVDRDAGPASDGTWRRRGVMQFHHAHTFRHQVIEALQAEMPEVGDALLAAGAIVAAPPEHPDRPMALLCRRPVFERMLRAAAVAQPGITLHTGHVGEVVRERGRAVGVHVDRNGIDAELVIDASGRSGRLTAAMRGPGEGGDCGATYVSRQYRLLPGAPPGPVNSPIGLTLSYQGYLAIVFLHDSGTFSVVIAYHSAEHRLRALRHPTVFEAAARAIPALAQWVDPARARPISPVQPGGRLTNTYRGQLDEAGRVALPGMISVGDAVCTTTPMAGRGVTLSFWQAQELLRLLAAQPGDLGDCAHAFHRWCDDHIKPWFDDHVHSDTDRVRRWSGQDIDLARPLPSDLVVAAAEADPELHAVVEPYTAMLALPASLAPAEPRARSIYADGWRPPVPAGPGIDEYAALCEELVTAA